jgi:hypothetical protein
MMFRTFINITYIIITHVSRISIAQSESIRGEKVGRESLSVEIRAKQHVFEGDQLFR